MNFNFELGEGAEGIRHLYESENSRFDRKYIFQVGQGRGLCAELIHILKIVQKCFYNKIQFCLGEAVTPRGYAIQNGWNDYFLPLFNIEKGRFLQTLNRPHFPLGRIPVIKTSAQLALHALYGKHYYMFNRLENVFLWEEFQGRLNLHEDYWEAMEQFVLSVFIYNARTNEAINEYAERICLSQENYAGVHIRRGDKITESPYVEVDRYAEKLIGIGDRSLPIYVATDDTSTIPLLQSALGNNYDICTCQRNKRKGYDQGSFNEESTKKRWEDTTFFLFELELLKNAKYFVGASPSNVFFWVRYNRGNKRLFDVNPEVVE